MARPCPHCGLDPEAPVRTFGDDDTTPIDTTIERTTKARHADIVLLEHQLDAERRASRAIAEELAQLRAAYDQQTIDFNKLKADVNRRMRR